MIKLPGHYVLFDKIYLIVRIELDNTMSNNTILMHYEGSLTKTLVVSPVNYANLSKWIVHVDDLTKLEKIIYGI